MIVENQYKYGEFLPEALLKRAIYSLNRGVLAAFLTAFFGGILVHLKLFTGKYANEDFLSYIQYGADHLRSGRWSEKFLISFRSDYSLPVVMGIIVIILLSVSAALTIAVLNIKNTLFACITALIMVSFPGLAYSFGYFMMAHTYAVSLFLSICAVACTMKWKYGYLPGAVCLSFSMGGYQAYVGFAMTLCIIILLLRFLDIKESFFTNIVWAAKFLVMGILGIVLYFVFLELCLYWNQTSLLSYKGIDTMGTIPLKDVPMLISRTYVHFFDFFKGDFFFRANVIQKICYGTLGLITFIVLLMNVIRLRKHIKQVIVLIFLVLLMPLCVNIIDFITPHSSANSLTIYPMVLVLIFPLACLEKMDIKQSPSGLFFIHWGAVINACVLVFSYFVLSNIYYLKLETYYERTLNMNNRILSRIEQLEGFTSDMPIAILSNIRSNIYGPEDPNEFAAIKYDVGLRGQYIGYCEHPGDEAIASKKTCAMIQNILGVKLKPATQEQIDLIINSEQYLDMEKWPSKDAVKIIDGVVAVNFFFPAQITLMEQDSRLIVELNYTNSLPQDCQFAIYLYRNGERIATEMYGTDTSWEFPLDENGSYYATIFIRNNKNEIIQVMNTQTFSKESAP